MIKGKALNKVLSQVLTGGIETVALLSVNGDVLASQALNRTFPESPEHNLLVSIVSNLWLAYATNDLSVSSPGIADPSALEAVHLDMGEQRLCVVPVGPGLLLVLVADQQVELGMLKLKTASLQRHLAEELAPVFEAAE